MKKEYTTPTIVLTKCQLEGIIAASGQGGDSQLPDEGKKPLGPDPDVPDQHAKEHFNAWTAWED